MKMKITSILIGILLLATAALLFAQALSPNRGAQVSPSPSQPSSGGAGATTTETGPRAQVPTLPEGAQTRWVITGNEEITVQLLFDTAGVADRLPDGLRFVTLTDVASRLPAAQDYLAAHPEHAQYGVSFLEIASGDFSIDGRKPQWPKNGANALWFAQVTSTGQKDERVRGPEHLSLLLLVPDRDYAKYMNTRGHYGQYGDVTLHRDKAGVRHGTIKTADLQVEAACTPTGELRTRGLIYQTIYPPRETVNAFLVLAVNGLRDGECRGTWKISGTHPLCKAIAVGAPIFGCCGNLLGGAYKMQDAK
jgi:hypothetical protein